MYRVNILREQGNAFVLSRSHVPSQRLHRGRSRRPVGDHTPLRAAEESMQPVVEQPGVDPKVAEALQKVQEAMNVAEGALDDVPNLPSARLPTVVSIPATFILNHHWHQHLSFHNDIHTKYLEISKQQDRVSWLAMFLSAS